MQFIGKSCRNYIARLYNTRSVVFAVYLIRFEHELETPRASSIDIYFFFCKHFFFLSLRCWDACYIPVRNICRIFSLGEGITVFKILVLCTACDYYRLTLQKSLPCQNF